VKYSKANTVHTQQFIAQYGKAARYPVCQAVLTFLRMDDGEFSALTKDVVRSEELVNSVKQKKEEAQAAIEQLNKQQREKEANIWAEFLRKIDKLLPGPQTQYNQVVITPEQLKQIGMLRDSMAPEESEELSRKVLEMTPEEWEEFRKQASECLARERNMEPETLPLPVPSSPVTCEVKIRGDGRGVEITGDVDAMGLTGKQ
jgi:hypothetical protein